jgi:hypothetical protein
VFGRLFQLGELGAFCGALSTRFSATGKGLNVSMLVARFGELFAGAGADVTERIGILRTALEQLSCQSRDPRTVARYDYRGRDDVHIALRKSRRYQTLTPAPRGITCFYAIAKFWWPHTSINYIR